MASQPTEAEWEQTVTAVNEETIREAKRDMPTSDSLETAVGDVSILVEVHSKGDDSTKSPVDFASGIIIDQPIQPRIICPILSPGSKLGLFHTINIVNPVAASINDFNQSEIKPELKYEETAIRQISNGKCRPIKPQIIRKSHVVLDALSCDVVDKFELKLRNDDLNLLWQQGQDDFQDIGEEYKAKIDQVTTCLCYENCSKGSLIDDVTKITRFSKP